VVDSYHRTNTAIAVFYSVRVLLDTVKARKLAYYGHTMRKRVCLEKDIMQGTMPGARK